MAQEFKEKTITVNMRGAFRKPETKRANAAKHILLESVKKETRLTDLYISNAVNEAIWARGRAHAPRRLVVKIINDKGKGRIVLPTEEADAKKLEAKVAAKKATKEAAPQAIKKTVASEKKATPSAQAQAAAPKKEAKPAKK